MKNYKNVFFLILFWLLNNQVAFTQYGETIEDSLAIAQELENMFGSYEGYEYEVYDIINIDSAKNYSNMFGRMTDPYGSLLDCIVFTSQTTVGIFKEGEIIWAFNMVTPEYSSSGKITGTIDLNNDGSVDIMTEWIDDMDMYKGTSMWIFSWNGLTGNVINDYDELQSGIICHGYKIFDIADFEGDGIWEIIGYGADPENDMADVPFVYSWNGTKYTSSEIEISTSNIFYPRNNFNAKIKATVIRISDSTFSYQYVIKNNSESKQYINLFDIGIISDSIFSLSSPEKWNSHYFGSAVSWQENSGNLPFIYSIEHKVKPGSELDNFIYETNGLPFIAIAHLRGYNNELFQGDEIYSEEDDYKNNSVVVQTISARTPPLPFNAESFLDTLISLTTRSLELNWIINGAIKDKYNSLFESAKIYLQENNTSAIHHELYLVLEELSIDSIMNITAEAYALIKYNTEYLLENLPEDQGSNFNIKLINSTGSLLTGGTLQYYEVRR